MTQVFLYSIVNENMVVSWKLDIFKLWKVSFYCNVGKKKKVRKSEHGD